MIIKALAVGPFQANCYIIGCPVTREALVIDPGDDPNRIAREISHHGLKPVAYLHTHGHVDHVGATATLKEKFGGEILIHRADLFFYERASEQALNFGIQIPSMAPVDRFLEEGDSVAWGKARAAVICTPGHSPGGICLRIPGRIMALDEDSGKKASDSTSDDAATDAARVAAHETTSGSRQHNILDPHPDWVFTGDTLFAGSIGRTDLPGGSFEELMKSIRDKLLVMPDETVVASGHGPLSTIGQEKKVNPFVLELL